MKTCTFFGNRDCGEEIRQELLSVIENCIVSRNVTRFYVGHNGNFDKMAISLLRQLKNKYPYIGYAVVLAYHPSLTKTVVYGENESIIPDGIEKVPLRYAIAHRNDWMLKNSECVVCCIQNKYGSAFKYVEKAARAGKEIFCVGESGVHIFKEDFSV